MSGCPECNFSKQFRVKPPEESFMDLNVRVFRVVQAALSDDKDSPTVSAKKASSRKDGFIGGPARAVAISAKRRSEIAKKASTARWKRRQAREPQQEPNGNSSNS
jgi:hypothetical protein